MNKYEKKNIIKTITFINILLIVLLFLINVLAKIIYKFNNFSIFLIGCVALILGEIILGIFFYVIKKGMSIFKILQNKENTINVKEYFRDISEKYSPAIVSRILDMNTEPKKDYNSVILYLCVKGYISIKKENEDIKFELQDKNTDNLELHEKYVIDCLFKGKKFDEFYFSELVQNDAIKLGLIQDKKNKIHLLRNLSIIIIGLIILFGLLEKNYNPIFNVICYILIFALFILCCSMVFSGILTLSNNNKNNNKRTLKGYEEAKKWSAFKNYVRDYTLIKDRNIEYIEILNMYIPYSLALGEAKIIEKYICQNENYKSFIYKYF